MMEGDPNPAQYTNLGVRTRGKNKGIWYIDSGLEEVKAILHRNGHIYPERARSGRVSICQFTMLYIPMRRRRSARIKTLQSYGCIRIRDGKSNSHGSARISEHRMGITMKELFRLDISHTPIKDINDIGFSDEDDKPVPAFIERRENHVWVVAYEEKRKSRRK